MNNIIKISILIPIFNEAETISKLLHYLTENAFHKQLEILVIDGGSTDDSQKIVEHCMTTIPFLQLLHSGKGRAKQMNYGAKHAKNTILYFLHADSFPPKHYDKLIINQINKGNLAGCFKMKFDSNHLWLRLSGWFTKFNWRISRGGDQSLFITKKLFNELGRYDTSYKIYEDRIFTDKLYDIKEFTVIPKWLTTSARLYKTNGVLQLQWHFFMIYYKKWQGASPQILYKYYKKHIK